MPENLIEHSFQRNKVCQRVADGYINLNQMANATGKRIDNWTRLQETKDLIAEFERQQDTASSDLRERSKALLSFSGGSGGGGSTWAHPDIAIQFAQWCSPAFALQVSRWVREWMITGRNPLADVDRVGLRDTLKDKSRLRMTDRVKEYLEEIRRYDDKRYRGKFFSQIHDSINVLITGETSQQMRNRLSALLGRKVKQEELIRDYFPAEVLAQYIGMCEASANLMIKDGLHPVTAVERSAEIVLPIGHKPTPINFVENIKHVRARIIAQIDEQRSDLYRRLADQ